MKFQPYYIGDHIYMVRNLFAYRPLAPYVFLYTTKSLPSLFAMDLESCQFSSLV